MDIFYDDDGKLYALDDGDVIFFDYTSSYIKIHANVTVKSAFVGFFKSIPSMKVIVIPHADIYKIYIYVKNKYYNDIESAIRIREIDEHWILSHIGCMYTSLDYFPWQHYANVIVAGAVVGSVKTSGQMCEFTFIYPNDELEKQAVKYYAYTLYSRIPFKADLKKGTDQISILMKREFSDDYLENFDTSIDYIRKQHVFYKFVYDYLDLHPIEIWKW